MTVSAGVRQFRQSLSDFIDQSEPVTVTRHGQTVGLFIPVNPDRTAAIAAYAEAVKKASALLAELDTTEDEVVAEFGELRKGAAPAGDKQ
jgi:antitoxin (DNA-binding transcriptional repressor) of toxin-antitoxin stability system